MLEQVSAETPKKTATEIGDFEAALSFASFSIPLNESHTLQLSNRLAVILPELGSYFERGGTEITPFRNDGQRLCLFGGNACWTNRFFHLY